MIFKRKSTPEASEPERPEPRCDDIMPAEGDWDALIAMGFAPPQPSDYPELRRTRIPPHLTWHQDSADGRHKHQRSYLTDERGLLVIETFLKDTFYERKARFYITDVGAHLAWDQLRLDRDEPPQLPEQWPHLTAAERDSFVERLDAEEQWCYDYVPDEDARGAKQKMLDRITTLRDLLAAADPPS